MKERGLERNSSVSSILITKEDSKKIDEMSNYFFETYGKTLFEVLKDRRKGEIPVSIFRKELSCLEAISVYLRNNAHLANKDIAKLIDRKENTISISYKNGLTKFSGKLKEEGEYFIPIGVIKDRRLSVLENICIYLKKEYDLTNNEIAKILNRNNKTVWTVINRGGNKKVGN